MKKLILLILALCIQLQGNELQTQYEQMLQLTEQTYQYVKRYPKCKKQWGKIVNQLKAKKVTDYKSELSALKTLRRRMILSHPDLDFSQLLINKRTLTSRGQRHMIDHYLGHNSIAHDGLTILTDWKNQPVENNILKGKLPAGDCRHPDLSFDGNKILFSYAKSHKDKWQQQFFIYEINVDGTGLRQITGTESDPLKGKDGRKTQIIEDFDPCYLPDGGIVFTSTRIQGHVRCAFGSRYCPTFCLYRMNNDGKDITQLSYGDIAEYDPVVLPDGRILYTRWEYNDRHDTWFQGLWTIRPDGTGTAHYYGNYTRSPCVITEAKPIPRTNDVLALATAHHWYFTGSVIKVDVDKGEDDEKPLTRMTPEVPFPETPGHRANVGKFSMPQPVNKELYFVSYLEPKTKQMAIYLHDHLGGRELIYRAKNASCYAATPIKPRLRPPVIASTLAKNHNNSGVFYIQNVYESRQPIPKDSVKYVRVVQIYDQPADKAPKVSAVVGMTPYKILGEVPVASNHSVAFRAPAGVPLYLQLLDENRMCVMGMRTFIYLQAGETSSCIGCHENTRMAVLPQQMGNIKVHDLTSPKSSDYPNGFSFLKSVQPVLDRHCISCHGLKKIKVCSLLGTPNKSITGPGFTPYKSFYSTQSYLNLVRFAKPAHRNVQTHFSVPKDYYSHASKLMPMLLKGHKNVKLNADEQHAIVSWLDLNVPMYGSWSWQQSELRSINSENEQKLRRYIAKVFGKKVSEQPLGALINVADVNLSRILLAPLSEKDGGWQQLKPLWRSRKDPRFIKMRQLVAATVNNDLPVENAGTCGMAGAANWRNDCQCGNCWIRQKFHNNKEK